MPVTEGELAAFIKRLQVAFMDFLPEELRLKSDPIPEEKDVTDRYYDKSADTYWIVAGKEVVGGVIVCVNPKTHHNHLDFFFIDPCYHSCGYGLSAWKAIEAKYPETKVWHTCTPYFEKRNIHFYVNKCRFKITEFYCRQHPDPHDPYDAIREKGSDIEDGFFEFEKIMK